MEKLKISLMADFSAAWSLCFPYNSGTEALIEAPQVPVGRARFCVFAS